MSRFLLLLFAVSLAPASAVFAQGGPATVAVAPVVEREFAATQNLIASVRPRRISLIGSAVDGRVDEFLVDAGQQVQEGETLAQLRTATIDIEIASAEAELALREAELLELKNGSRPEEIELAEATARAAEAARQYAQAKLARFRKLYETRSGLSQDEFEAAEAEAIAAVERVAETQNTLALAKKGPRQERIQQAEARVAVQKQVVNLLRDRKNKYTIRAPFDGFVSTESTEIGAWIQQGDAIAEVAEIDPVEVEVFVPEGSVQYLSRGDRCSVHVDAVGDEPLVGVIDRVIPLADDRSRTFPVRILIDNPEFRLLPGMLARVSLPAEPSRRRLIVPKDAIQFGESGDLLMKVVEGNATPVPVRPGTAVESWIAVEPLQPGSLAAGDLVVTLGNERLRPGQPLKITDRQPGLE